MGKRSAGGGRRTSSARTGNYTANAYDIARGAIRGMDDVRITTSSFDTVTLETSGSKAAIPVMRMRTAENRLKDNFVKTSDRQVVEPFGENRWRWVSEFRRK